jgi:hypothetical protein
MKLLNLMAGTAMLALIGGAIAGARNTANAANLSAGAPALRALALPGSGLGAEKTYYYQTCHRRHHHRWCETSWRPEWNSYYLRHYWTPYYQAFPYPHRFYCPYWYPDCDYRPPYDDSILFPFS